MQFLKNLDKKKHKDISISKHPRALYYTEI